MYVLLRRMTVLSDVRWRTPSFSAVSRASSPPPSRTALPSPSRRCWGLGCYLITCAATLCTSPMRPTLTYCIRFAPYLLGIAHKRPQCSRISFGFSVRCSHLCRCNALFHHHGAACRLIPSVLHPFPLHPGIH